MKNFRLLNNIFGWVIFLIASITYLMTMEATASFWDCGEFIASAYKFNVGHPPGAPFFMLSAKFFTLFTSDPTKVALMVNSFSAISSAFTILFLFWTITHIGRKITTKSEETISLTNGIAVLGAGMVGALAYTFSDTFWFSAVEAEVYAYSSFFTAIVFWLMLKWEDNAHREGSDRWLILIAYLMGLSIGVHLLNLLALPAIVLIYYFKKYEPTTKGFIIAIISSVAILAFVYYGLIPGSVGWAVRFELFFVNTLGLSYNTGLFTYIGLVVVLLIWAIYESNVNKNRKRMYISYISSMSLIGIPFLANSIIIGVLIIVSTIIYFFLNKKISSRWLNTTLVMALVMLIGYSSYAIIMIRSSAEPTMDQNSPDNIFSLQYYLNREQYGNRPLVYGATFDAPMKLKVEGNNCTYDIDKEPLYAPKPKDNPNEKDKYIVAGHKYNPKKNKKFMMLFPRMYSSDKAHISAYKMWGNVTGKKIKYDYCGETRTGLKPTMWENLTYFFSYQVNFMYWRYFMWNFSGRQNDMQGNGEIEHGNWITGIPFIDDILVGNQTYLPKELKENKGRNVYFMLPFLLGLLGIFYMINKNKAGNHNFWIVLTLFFMTGLAIVIYLNQTPYQPRERDYAYAGSFYAFAIWIGIGVLGVSELMKKFLPNKVSAILASVICLLIPIQMAGQNWDDHDRSNRTVARDFGQNYLQSCEPNAILFCNGDNDTFPLWYNQEVEGVRTDIRVCNLSYLPTDWYIDQMKRGAYKSAPLPISWSKKQYISGTNDVIMSMDMYDGKSLDMKTAFDIIKSDDPDFKYEGESFFPVKSLYLPIDKEKVIKTGTVSKERKEEIVSKMLFNLPRSMYKNETMVLEMIKENEWKRPMYICTTVSDDAYPKSLQKYMERTGLALQILPINKKNKEEMNVNTDKMYNNMMTKFKFGGIDQPNVYIDDNVMRMCRTHRISFIQLADELINEGDTTRAKKALAYCEKVIPAHNVPYTEYTDIEMAKCYYRLNMMKSGNRILESIAQNNVDYLKWYVSLNENQQISSINAIKRNLIFLSEVLKTANNFNAGDVTNKFEKQLEYYATTFGAR